MTQKFIAFRVNGYDTDDRVPIATGATRDEAEGKAIRRVLSICDVESCIETVEQHKLTDAEFAQIGAICDEWAAKHCGIAA